MAYEKGVANNRYKPLPDINAVNFGLLTSEVCQKIVESLTEVVIVLNNFRKNGFWFLIIYQCVHQLFVNL